MFGENRIWIVKHYRNKLIIRVTNRRFLRSVEFIRPTPKKASSMGTAVKREIIELPSDVLEKLSTLAKESGKSLKTSMEYILTRKADGENISPSNDPWYQDEENVKMVEEGIRQL